MRQRHGAPVAAPPELGHGIVTRPGPLLRDVQAELEARGRPSGPTPDRFQLCDQTREAFELEARDICDHASNGMDFDSGAGVQGSGSARSAAAPEQASAADDADAPVVVRHRFARPRDGSDQGARRVVTLRDRRMGRPPSKRHGTDPPA
jgi:hypothetical protein